MLHVYYIVFDLLNKYLFSFKHVDLHAWTQLRLLFLLLLLLLLLMLLLLLLLLLLLFLSLLLSLLFCYCCNVLPFTLHSISFIHLNSIGNWNRPVPYTGSKARVFILLLQKTMRYHGTLKNWFTVIAWNIIVIVVFKFLQRHIICFYMKYYCHTIYTIMTLFSKHNATNQTGLAGWL